VCIRSRRLPAASKSYMQTFVWHQDRLSSLLLSVGKICSTITFIANTTHTRIQCRQSLCTCLFLCIHYDDLKHYADSAISFLHCKNLKSSLTNNCCVKVHCFQSALRVPDLRFVTETFSSKSPKRSELVRLVRPNYHHWHIIIIKLSFVAQHNHLR
jgi:hypothetical protein